MSARTVTVHTVDHGDVTIPEPSWCVEEHTFEAYRVDIQHTGPDLVLTVPAEGDVVPVFTAAIVKRPFSPQDPRTLVQLEVDEWRSFDAAGLDALAASLVEHAATLRKLARELSVLQEADQ
ncbi:DUF6907 domain-containing protein [Streptomyces pristinaespiralis]|uniref:DUF6907 domain-containing protein n=1 Tax=Streptomyces pristinaespiralis TaxID=38300 RepID=UPI0038387823